MLTFLQNKKNQKLIYLVLFLLIAPPFLLWGIVESMNEKRSPSVLGTYDGKKVSLRDFLASYRAVHHGLLLTYGDRAGHFRQFIDVRQEAWDRLILSRHAEQFKLSATDQEVVDWLKAQSVFAGRSGSFDPERYKLIVTQFLRTNTRSFEEEVRQTLSIEKVRAQIQSRIEPTESDLKNLYDQEYGKRKLLYAVLPWKAKADAATATDEEIEALYQVVQDQLTEPETVRLRYLYVPEPEVDRYAAALQDETSPLEALASSHGLELKRTEPFSRNDPVPDIGLSREILVFAFQEVPGSTSKWIRGERGRYKVQIADRTSERKLGLEEAKQTLKDLVQREQAVQAASKTLGEWTAQLGDQDFETYFKTKGALVRRLDDFASGSFLPDVGTVPAVQSAIFGVRAGRISPVLTFPEGALVVKVLEESPADPAQFEKDKSRFSEVTRRRLAQLEFQGLLDTLRKRLKIDEKAMSVILAGSS